VQTNAVRARLESSVWVAESLVIARLGTGAWVVAGCRIRMARIAVALWPMMMFLVAACVRVDIIAPKGRWNRCVAQMGRSDLTKEELCRPTARFVRRDFSALMVTR
jgi:hypothetical protein